LPAGRSVKGVVKRAFKATARAAAPICRISSPCTRILTYHNVGSSSHEMNVTPDHFREQMTWLHANHRVISLEAACVEPTGVAITFDDGYRDNLTNAAPTLNELGMPATVFMVAGYAGKPLRAEQGSEAGLLMTWSELRELEAMGITIGSHTLTHPRLSTLDEAGQQMEIRESRVLLEEELGHKVSTFAYPFGAALDFTAETVQIVRDAGYSLAVSNQYGVTTPESDRWALKRIWIDETDTLQTFQAKVNGDLDALRWLDSPMGIRGRRLLNRLMRVG
jgi:peptidoglycan/xylan/chitin deacetylase (PgdA/CDA1 family)